MTPKLESRMVVLGGGVVVVKGEAVRVGKPSRHRQQ